MKNYQLQNSGDEYIYDIRNCLTLVKIKDIRKVSFEYGRSGSHGYPGVIEIIDIHNNKYVIRIYGEMDNSVKEIDYIINFFNKK